LGGQEVLRVRVELKDIQRQRLPGVRRGRGVGLSQGLGLLVDVVRLIALLLAVDRCRVDTEIAGQLVQHDLGLDPQLLRSPLHVQRQHVTLPVRQALGGGNRAAGPVPAAYLGHVPAQAQRAEYLG
jgi:hypothetical protein